MMALILLMGLGGMAVSCQKEQIVKNPGTEQSGLVATRVIDEDPAIKGKVKKSNQMPVNKALVETYDALLNIKIAETYTNGYGDFTQRVPIGVYYLKVTNPDTGNSVYTTKLRENELLNFLEIIVD